MGKTVINSDIGTDAFKNYSKVALNDTNLCSDDKENCKLVEEKCSFWVNLLAALLNSIGYGAQFVKCPLQYYKCQNNIVMLSKLLSGYYSGQKLPNGVEYNKPAGLNKCSHGGILDGSTFVKAEGGINKDSGYTIFSPHADLHLAAATLAINHTRMFFDEIRSEIGDKEFNEFLKLKINETKLSSLGDVSCDGARTTSTLYLLFACCMIINLIILNK